MNEEGRPPPSEPPRPATPAPASSTGPPPAPPPTDRRERRLRDDQRPATAQQFKSLRRWLIVAGVWAVAATGLAVFALIEANQAEEAAGEEATGQAGRVQRELDGRIDGLEARIEELPTSDDVSNLDNRLGQVDALAALDDEDHSGRHAAEPPPRESRGACRRARADGRDQHQHDRDRDDALKARGAPRRTPLEYWLDLVGGS